MNRIGLHKKQLYTFISLCTLFVLFIIGRVIGEVGVAYLTVSLLLFLLLFSLFGSAFARSLSELLVYRKEREQYRNMQQMKLCASWLQLCAGVLFGMFLFIGAKFLATNLLGISSMALLFRLIAALLPLRLLTVLYEGYFYAENLEVHSLVIKMGRLVLTLGLTGLLIGPMGEYGARVSELLNQKNVKALYLVAAVLVAIVAAEVLALIAYALIYYKKISPQRMPVKSGMRLTDSKVQCLRLLFQKRISGIMERMLILLPLFLAFLYWNTHSSKVDGIVIYGVYIGQFCLLTVTVAYLLYLGSRGLLDKVAEHLTKKESRHARFVFHLGIHHCLCVGIYATVFFTVMAKHIASVFSIGGTKVLENMLKNCSIIMLLACLFMYLYGFMREHTLQKEAMFSLGIGAVIYILGMIVLCLVKKPVLFAPVFLALVCLFISCVFMWLICFRHLRMHLDWMRAFVVPLGVGCAVGLVGMLFAKLFTPHLGVFFTLIMTTLVTILLYWMLLLLLQNFSKKDLMLIPTGKALKLISRIFHFF